MLVHVTDRHIRNSSQLHHLFPGFSAFGVDGDSASGSDSDSEFEASTNWGESTLIDEEAAVSVNLAPVTGALAVLLLDLIHTLFSRATSIYTEWRTLPSDHPSDKPYDVLSELNAAQEVQEMAVSPGEPDTDLLWQAESVHFLHSLKLEE
ncbi:unnamed protein product [Protopolystoma xenopodis]|uniref:Uncharacterized protein n=1 Tax=Protopolystoma xenopodis TaxID=117903 RepID=A0A448WPY0_9PLAT|nr:unnamed protein product [Protopolystoma xenopodis]